MLSLGVSLVFLILHDLETRDWGLKDCRFEA